MTKIGLWFYMTWKRVQYAYTQARSFYASPIVEAAESYGDIVLRLAYGRRYKADGKRDHMLHPRRFQNRLYAGEAGLGDCEDHAAYWIAATTRSALAEQTWLGIVHFEEDGKRKAHAVAVFERNSKWYWADYTMPTAIPRRDAWAQSVLDMYGGKGLGAGLVRTIVTADDTVEFTSDLVLMPKRQFETSAPVPAKKKNLLR